MFNVCIGMYSTADPFETAFENVTPSVYMNVYSRSHLLYVSECSIYVSECVVQVIYVCVQQIPLGVTFSNAVSKLKAKSSNVSFH